MRLYCTPFIFITYVVHNGGVGICNPACYIVNSMYVDYKVSEHPPEQIACSSTGRTDILVGPQVVQALEAFHHFF